jgi:secreted PhoX family phosphatase
MQKQGAGFKVIYAFDLLKKQMEKEPVFKIAIGDKVLQNNSVNKNSSIMLSEIAINPVTHDIFITDGPKAKLLILDNAARMKKLYELGNQFAQPEGITFSPQGDLYISNEGKKVPGNIMQVELK